MIHNANYQVNIFLKIKAYINYIILKSYAYGIFSTFLKNYNTEQLFSVFYNVFVIIFISDGITSIRPKISGFNTNVNSIYTLAKRNPHRTHTYIIQLILNGSSMINEKIREFIILKLKLWRQVTSGGQLHISFGA